MNYDLILRNGHVIDPSQNIDGPAEIAIQNGIITEIKKSFSVSPEIPTIDLTGKYICPGLIDLHGHWYEGSSYGIDPNGCLNDGVTTVIDAGTTGFVNFQHFRRHTIDSAKIEVLAFIHIGGIGIPTTLLGELEDLRYARPRETSQVINNHRDVALGVKIREGIMSGKHGLEALDYAVMASQKSDLPLMVHISQGAETPKILDRLKAGDIVTHCFQGRGDGILTQPSGPLLTNVTEARKRGVFFDVGHGCGSFCWETARRSFEYHFYPDTISTDLHRFSVDRFTKNLPTTLSKFLHLGMSLKDVISKSTWIPAQAIGRSHQLGTLKTNTIADIFAFEIEEGEFKFEDTHMRTEIGKYRIKPLLVLKAGEVIYSGQIEVRLRELFDCDKEYYQRIEGSA